MPLGPLNTRGVALPASLPGGRDGALSWGRKGYVGEDSWGAEGDGRAGAVGGRPGHQSSALCKRLPLGSPRAGEAHILPSGEGSTRTSAQVLSLLIKKQNLPQTKALIRPLLSGPEGSGWCTVSGVG